MIGANEPSPHDMVAADVRRRTLPGAKTTRLVTSAATLED
jgi:hypothetical protein